MDYFFLIAGIAVLIASGNWLVKSGTSIARHFKIPPFIIGVTVISLGTSAPELFVSLNAAIKGFSDVAIGNIVGSNIANLGMVLAISAIIISIPIQKSTIKIDYPVLLLSGLVFAYFMLDNEVSRADGIIMLVIMAAYLFFIIRYVKNSSEQTNDCVEEPTGQKPAVSILFIILSCGGLVAGSTMLVEGSVNIATELGVSKRIISITMIAFGTSLPELATSIIAAFKKRVDIAVGNIIGSNIFNTLVIGGISATVKPLSVNPEIVNFDLIFMLGFTVLLGLFFIPFKKPKITRIKGVILLSAFFIYYIALFTS
jgi:cation:H+ antiporter